MMPTHLAPPFRLLIREIFFLAAGGLIFLAIPSPSRSQQQELPPVIVPAERVRPQEAPSPPPKQPTPTPTPLKESGRTPEVANTIGSQVSASQGTVTQADLRDKPLFRTTEFLEHIPGMIITTETGGIDANTMYLRGFLIDHGTDFAFFVDGMPINQDNNLHAQGYTDLQWVIPELIANVEYGKGPY